MDGIDVLLINPPRASERATVGEIFPPLGLAYLASSLEQNNFSVNIIDAFALDFNIARIGTEIENKKPKIVGISCDISRVGTTKEILRLGKKNDVFSVVGGPVPSNLPSVFYGLADAVCIGEGEVTFVELADAYLNGGELESVRGIHLRSEDGYVDTGKREFITNLDDLPKPARHLLPMEKYHSKREKRKPSSSIITSRGCPYTCIFCSVPCIMGARPRFHSPQYVLEELGNMTQIYGIREVYFQDSIFTLDTARIMEICKGIIQKNIDISWICRARIQGQTKELLTKMREAGCHTIYYGLESGNENILKSIKKGISTKQVEETIALTTKAGIRPFAQFIIGFPWETREEILDTIRFAKKINAYHYYFSICTPLPGTYLWDYCTEHKLINPKNIDWNSCSFTVASNTISSLSPNELHALQRKAYIECYVNGKHILYFLYNSNLSEIFSTVSLGARLLRDSLK